MFEYILKTIRDKSMPVNRRLDQRERQINED